MKRITIITVSLILCYSISAQDFRKASWGNSQAIVKSGEQGVEWEQTSNGIYDVLYFGTNISGLSTTAIYLFIDNKLVRCRYTFDAEHSNDNDYISDFEKIGESLQTKYGKKEKNEIWRNDLYKDDPSQYGFAVSYGHYVLSREWEIEGKTSIFHVLSGENFEIQHVLEYTSIALEDFVEQKQKEAELEVF